VPWAAFNTGESMRQNVELRQFIVAANGTTPAGIISGTYVHTTGPKVSP
jgi:hypothetical protein